MADDLTLPESVIAGILGVYSPKLVVENNGVGSIVVNRRRYDVPRECSEKQAIEIIKRIQKDNQ